MSERVVSVDLGIRWEPNAPEARLSVNDAGEARLRVDSHPQDGDRRLVELVWNGAVASRMEPPDDEAIAGHRLYDGGLADVRWAGEVQESDLIADLIRRNEVHQRHSPALFEGLRHWILPLKGCVVEVVARGIRVERVEP